MEFSKININNTEYQVKDSKSRNDIELLKNYITPEMFGAIGDGESDDYESLISAINYCIANKKQLKLTKTYAIGSQIVLTNSINIDGVGYQNSGLKYIGPENLSFIVFNVGSDFSSIKNITIDGNNKSSINIEINVPYVDVKNCLIKNNILTCIQLSRTYCDNFIENRMYGGDYAILSKIEEFTNQAGINAIAIERNVILFCEKIAIVAGGGDSWLVDRNTIEASKQGVAYVSYISNFTFTNNYVENCSKYPMKYMMANEEFYIRSIISFNNSKTFDLMLGSAQSYNAVIENNFINIDTLEGEIPEGSKDYPCLCLCEGVRGLSIKNNHGTTNTRYIVLYGSRSSNTVFYDCVIENNIGFLDSKMIGGFYDSLTVKPNINDYNVPEYNYMKQLDFSDCQEISGCVIPLSTDNYFYNSKIYNINQVNKYSRITIPESQYENLKGKTVYLGFYGKIPSETKVKFYTPLLYEYTYFISNTSITKEEWNFIGCTINIPSDITGDLVFYFLVDNIPSEKTVEIAKPILAEIGTDLNKLMIS